jgi:hypothetical protein
MTKRKPQNPCKSRKFWGFSEPEMGLTKTPMTALYGTFTAFFAIE